VNEEKECLWCGRPHSRRSKFCSDECRRWYKLEEPIRDDIAHLPRTIKNLFWDIMHGNYFTKVRAQSPRNYAATCLSIAAKLSKYPITHEEIRRLGKIEMRLIRRFKSRGLLTPQNYAELVKFLCDRKGFKDVSGTIYKILKEHPIKGSPSISSVAAAMVVLLYEMHGMPVMRGYVAKKFGISKMSLRIWIDKLRPIVLEAKKKGLTHELSENLNVVR